MDSHHRGRRVSRASSRSVFNTDLSEPDKVHHFSWHVDNCCNFLSQIGRADVDGNAVFASVVAHSDFDFRLANPARRPVAHARDRPVHRREVHELLEAGSRR